MLLTFTERTREFGILRAIGWSRRRIMAMVVGETLLVILVGAAAGVAPSFFGVRALQRLPSLQGVIEPDYTAAAFGDPQAVASRERQRARGGGSGRVVS